MTSLECMIFLADQWPQHLIQVRASF